MPAEPRNDGSRRSNSAAVPSERRVCLRTGMATAYIGGPTARCRPDGRPGLSRQIRQQRRDRRAAPLVWPGRRRATHSRSKPPVGQVRETTSSFGACHSTGARRRAEGAHSSMDVIAATAVPRRRAFGATHTLGSTTPAPSLHIRLVVSRLVQRAAGGAIEVRAPKPPRCTLLRTLYVDRDQRDNGVHYHAEPVERRPLHRQMSPLGVWPGSRPGCLRTGRLTSRSRGRSS